MVFVWICLCFSFSCLWWFCVFGFVFVLFGCCLCVGDYLVTCASLVCGLRFVLPVWLLVVDCLLGSCLTFLGFGVQSELVFGFGFGFGFRFYCL